MGTYPPLPSDHNTSTFSGPSVEPTGSDDVNVLLHKPLGMIYERVMPGEIKAVFRLSLSFDGRIINDRSYDQHPFILHLSICEVPSVISRCQASNVRECPDLEEVDIGISIRASSERVFLGKILRKS